MPGNTRVKGAKPISLNIAAGEQKRQKKRPPSANVKSAMGQKSKAGGSYRDWQVREEASSAAKKIKSATKSTALQSASTTQKMGASMTMSTGQNKSRRDKKSAGSKARSSKSRSKSRPRSISHETTDDIRKRV